MAKDSYSEALKQRRGASIDPSMLQMAYGGDQSPESQIDEAVDEIHQESPHADPMVAQTLGEAIGYPGSKKPQPHPKEAGEGEEAIENVKDGAVPVGLKEAKVDSDGDYDGDQAPAHDEIRDHVIGHESPDEYERMKDRPPTSLGERVKMAALKEKYEKA